MDLTKLQQVVKPATDKLTPHVNRLKGARPTKQQVRNSLIPKNFGQALNFGVGLLAGGVNASLVSEEDGALGLPLVFSLNPSGVSMSKENKTEGDRGVIRSTFQDALKATSNVRLQLTDAQVTGAGITALAIDTLVKWATPIRITQSTAIGLGSGVAAIDRLEGFAANVDAKFEQAQAAAKAAAKAAKAAKSGAGPGVSVSSPSYGQLVKNILGQPVYYRLPILRFTWGPGAPLHNCQVNLEKVSVNYQRFDFSGTPVWAKLSLTLVEYNEDLPPTNPTSRGVAGRTRHVLSQGENLIQIANRVYGSPDAWRLVAEANGIDDPLRVRPGRSLALPPAESLTGAVAR